MPSGSDDGVERVATMARYDCVLFDLLTALLDSWSLWNAVAGDDADGRRWRAEYLRITYATGAYRPYEDLVAEAAEAAGLARSLAADLDRRYGEIEPWPDAPSTLQTLAAGGIRLGVVTNCSRRLGTLAAGRAGGVFDVVMTAEEAGFYKPDERPYRLALDALGAEPRRSLFVAGSAYDLFGTAKLGLPTYWHDRVGMTPPPGAPEPIAHERTLAALPGLCGLA